MAITEKDEELIESGFIDAFESGLPEGQEMAEKALTAWNRLWELMIRENNFSNELGSQILDWQIGNWAQDVSMVLHNVKLYQDEIAINEQILKIDWKRQGHDNNFHDNAKRDIADAYADLGDLTTSYKLYEQYLDEEPLWGWAWIGYFRQLHDNKNSRYEEVLDVLYSKIVSGTVFRDMEDLCRELGDEFEALGENEKAKDCAERSKVIAKTTQTGYLSNSFLNPVIKEKKVYPNDLCPCGSGKKYKKCCGRK